MAKRKVEVNASKCITMKFGSHTRTYFSAESAARWWAKWTQEYLWRDNRNAYDPTGKREAKLKRRALPIFERYFGEQK